MRVNVEIKLTKLVEDYPWKVHSNYTSKGQHSMLKTCKISAFTLRINLNKFL